MSEHSASVQAAVALENRLTTMEATLSQLVTVNTEMRDHVKAQNGRIGKLETSHHELEKKVHDKEEIIDTPKWARFESIASQVKALWAVQERREQADLLREETGEAQRRWWQSIKIRFETVLAVLGIAGGLYALTTKLVGG